MKKNIRYTIAYIVLIVLMLCLLLLNICIGSVDVPFNEAMQILFGGSGSEVGKDIVLMIRLPRALAAGILGGALALSGYLLQTFFRNPIAGPFVLGISSGAKFVVALVMVACLNINMVLSSGLLIVAAFVGALMATFFVLALSSKVKSISMLVVGGVMVGYICTAITDFVVTFADDSNIVNLHNWSKGSFSGISWDNVLVMSIIIAVTFVAAFTMSKPIGAYLLGDAYAINMGINLRIFRVCLIILSSILSATVTAFAGPVSFVGVAVPHLTKQLLGVEKPILLIPGCFLGGVCFSLMCDLIARCVFAPTELSISTVTAVFGAPIVIYLLVRKKSSKGSR